MLNKELTSDFIASKRYTILQSLKNSHINFQWQIGRFFIDKKVRHDEDFLAAESRRLPKVKRKKTKVDYLYSTEMVEYDKNSPVPFRSYDILIFDSSRQLAPDGIINNLFPDNDLESFLKLNTPNKGFTEN